MDCKKMPAEELGRAETVNSFAGTREGTPPLGGAVLFIAAIYELSYC
jgi:hypothetical protein